MYAVIPRQDVAATVRNIDGGRRDRRLGFPGWNPWGLWRRTRGATCRIGSGSHLVWKPALKRSEVGYIGDVPGFLRGVPAGSKGLRGVLLGERGDQVDSHAGNYLRRFRTVLAGDGATKGRKPGQAALPRMVVPACLGDARTTKLGVIVSTDYPDHSSA